ncbi:class I SAM-dependent methyltransferase [Pseudonocardia saturnea]
MSLGGSPAEWRARLSEPGSPVCAPDWLALREPADAAARSAGLLGDLAPAVVHDLGCGTGSMLRWLAPRLPTPQHWVLHDRDTALLERAVADLPPGVTAETRVGDLTALRAADLAPAQLVTASALLDMLTAEEVDGIAAACARAGCPVLLAMTVSGEVEIVPSDPLDAEFAAAFDAHQRRTVDGRRLLGPDAGPVAIEAFTRHGMTVTTRPSPWRLGAAEADLAEEWLRGWISAACAQRPELGASALRYLQRRLVARAAGVLRVSVGHVDLSAVPS